MKQPTTIEELRRQVRASLRNMDATPAAPLPTETEIDRQLTRFWGGLDKNTANRVFIEGVSDTCNAENRVTPTREPTPQQKRARAVADDLRSLATFERKHTVIEVTYHDGSKESLREAAGYLGKLLGVTRNDIYSIVKAYIIP